MDLTAEDAAKIAIGERRGILPHDLVKASIDSERMWFEVVSVDGDEVRARLDNVPSRFHRLSHGDEVTLCVDELLDFQARSEA